MTHRAVHVEVARIDSKKAPGASRGVWGGVQAGRKPRGLRRGLTVVLSSGIWFALLDRL
jgi:hypothetical protein